MRSTPQWTKETGKKAVISYAVELGARQADRAGRPGADVHLGRPRLDGLSRGEEPHQAGYALQPARQPHRADRPQGQGAAGRDQARASTLPGSSATAVWRWRNVERCRPASTARRRWRSSGVWASVSSKIAQAENVRAALLLVSRGEAPAGIVYQTDAAADPNVKIIGTFPEDTHPPIIYPIALTASATHPDAARIPGLHQIGQGASRCSRRRASPCSARAVLTRCRRRCAEAIRRMDWMGLSPEEWTAVRLSLKVAMVATLVSLPFGIAIAMAAGARPVLGPVAAQRPRASCR